MERAVANPERLNSLYYLLSLISRGESRLLVAIHFAGRQLETARFHNNRRFEMRRNVSLTVVFCAACMYMVTAIAACDVAGSEAATATQEVVGPVVTVTPRAAADQLAVSWSVDPVATRYDVFRSDNSGALLLAAQVFDSSGGPPGTSYIDTGLTAGAHCYSIRSAYPSGAVSDFGALSCRSTATTAAQVVAVVAGSLFQLAGNTSPTEQLWIAAVNTLLIGQKVIAGSVAVQCVGAGGGYFIPCARSREVGGWQCGSVTACGTAATSSVPFPTAFVVGAQNHLDLGIVAAAPTFVATTAVLTVQ